MGQVKVLLYTVCNNYLGSAVWLRLILVLPNINGVTLHSLLNLKLPIRGKNCCKLKDSLLADMQAGMANICYLTIDEFSIIGKRMLGWIDRRL